VLTRGLERKTLISIGTALLFVLAACGGDDGDSEAEEETPDDTGTEEPAEEAAPPPSAFEGQDCDVEDTNVVAQAKYEELEQIDVYAEPDGDVLASMDTVWTSAAELEEGQEGTPLNFRVTDETDQEQADWLHVDLPLPVADSGETQGYIEATDVTTSCNAWKITIDRANFELTLTNNGEEMLTAPVGLGRDERATQTGEYYVTELIDVPDDAAAYGPFAFAINGFSDDPDVVAEFGNNGVAMVGIHGTSDPSSIGTQASSGCIRMNNEDVTALAQELGVPRADGTSGIPLGTRVEVV
jgi:hypothetical protein